MKLIITIFIFIINIQTALVVLNQQTNINDPQDHINLKEENLNFNQDSTNDLQDEDYYQDIFLRKLKQKKLNPLSKKEKIIWSFRMSETYPFL